MTIANGYFVRMLTFSRSRRLECSIRNIINQPKNSRTLSFLTADSRGLNGKFFKSFVWRYQRFSRVIVTKGSTLDTKTKFDHDNRVPQLSGHHCITV